ncbi:MAG: ATP-binding protein [Desulfobacterales bacterium]
MTFENIHRPPTRWSVITGAPCSGKTAVIKMLEQRGYKVVHEVARAYIDNELMRGKTLPQIKADEWAFERHILMEKVRIESTLKKDEVIFFDRGVPDSIAYYKLNGLDPTEPFQKSGEVRYQNVFLFEKLRFLTDPVRSEDEKTARRLNRLIEESYQSLGYDIIHVPVLSVEERTEFILKHL